MRITGINTIIVNAEMRNWVFVRVETDAGIVGWGEASLEWKTHAVAGAVEDLAPFIVNQDPRRIEHLYQIMYRQPFFRAGVVGMSALSGIEMACWDILGKSLGRPVYELLGGRVRDSIRLYDHLGGGSMEDVYLTATPEEFRDRARRSVEQGFTAVKVLVVPRSAPLEHVDTIRHTERLMQALRDELGDGVDIMVDFHGRTIPAAAIAYARALEPYRPYFIEEPCPPENVDGMAEVARATSIPVATGERLVTRYQFREVFEKRACAVVQPDICHCGGLWEARKIAAMAETYYMSVAPHNPLGPLATAAAIQLDLAIPNFLIQEVFRSDVPWRDEIVTQPLDVRGGRTLPPREPGLGVEINEKEAAKHPFQPERLIRYWHDDGAVADW